MPNESENPVITPEQLALGMRLGSIFMPYAQKQIQTLYTNELTQPQARFVHYTSAEAALSIIKSKRMWMRNTKCMADYREVLHGFEIFNKFFADGSKQKALVGALDACIPGAAQEAINRFNQASYDIQFNTYITAVSEHDAAEDRHGRLSMWRSFGGNLARVGIVFSIPKFSGGTFALNVLFSPVAYLTNASAYELLDGIIENVRTNRDFLCTVNQEQLVRTVYIMLLAGVVCLKHEGFREEREWRAIYFPSLWPSQLMRSSTEVVQGIPQIVHQIPLDGTISESLADLEFSRIFERLIIGPTQYPGPMAEAFMAELTKVGIGDAKDRLHVSGIPIRT